MGDKIRSLAPRDHINKRSFFVHNFPESNVNACTNVFRGLGRRPHLDVSAQRQTGRLHPPGDEDIVSAAERVAMLIARNASGDHTTVSIARAAAGTGRRGK